MTELASIVEFENHGIPGCQIVAATVTSDGDTFTSKFREIKAAFVNDITTKGGASVSTVSGGTLVVDCTGGDEIYLIVYGLD